jgi:hypothetical protein
MRRLSGAKAESVVGFESVVGLICDGFDIPSRMARQLRASAGAGLPLRRVAGDRHAPGVARDQAGA